MSLLREEQVIPRLEQELTPISRDAAETLAAKLVVEMIERWRQRERPLVEDFLTRHPELWQHPAAAADLIYEELCLRQEYGPELPVEQVLTRFPQWRPQLEVLLDCQRVLGPRHAVPQFPTAGEFLGDFLLLAELGGGAHGRVFLASQLSLGDRPVVLKLTAREIDTACEAREHLSLARLQHTHIVPLYSVQDYPLHGLRALCMPYFGGATLDQLFEAMHAHVPVQRTGQSLLDALDRVQADLIAGCRLKIADLPLNLQSATRNLQSRRALAGASYVQAVCRIGACLADALHYAHERGLVHLDLKPSNVLLAADGQPMLLDFHLAREPIYPGVRETQWLGGTVGYMSPEQQTALRAIEQGRSIASVVDGRSDIYSLGVVLYEALSGTLPRSGSNDNPLMEPARIVARPRPLNRCNADVTVGLADVIAKCLAADPGDRYPDMAALAADLRRHLAHLPLSGVPNRSVAERWRKWQRRRPHAVALAGMMLAVLTATAAVLLGATSYFVQRISGARAALEEGHRQMERREWEGAISTLQHGLSMVPDLPFQRNVVDELNRQLSLAEQARAAAYRDASARALHELADRVRFLYGAGNVPAGALRGLEDACRDFWEDRARVVERLSPAGAGALEARVRDDLLDLAIFWAHLQMRRDASGSNALRVLREAEVLFGRSPVLDEERKLVSAVGCVGPPEPTRPDAPRRPHTDLPPSTAWEHCALARCFLWSDNLERAERELEQALRLEPQGLWPNFYEGLCAFRQGRYADAVAAYSVCIGAAPEPAGCFYNRALAFEALGCSAQALRDYDHAVRLDASLAAAVLNRGMLHYREKRYAAALADLQRARELGADPGVREYAAALEKLRRTQSRNAQQPGAH